jgi:hypothetical protein
MLSYLVTSKARRRLLTLLWVEQVTGTTAELAARAHVSFASAYRELRAMQRWDLVVSELGNDGTTYAANHSHPDADVLRRLAVPVPTRKFDPAAAELRAHLSEAGAPLRADQPSTPRPPLDEMVVDAVRLARRDPEVARTLPVLLHRHRAEIPSLARRASEEGVGHHLGFLLAVTARLTRDPDMARTAATLRDHRVKRQDFFLSSTRSSSTTFPLARKWGLQMRADMTWFRGLFEKFEKLDAREATR